MAREFFFTTQLTFVRPSMRFLAMAQHRLGQGANAREQLARFEQSQKGQQFAT